MGKKAGMKLLHNRVEPTHLMCQCVRLKLFPRRCYLKHLSMQDLFPPQLVLYSRF